MILSMRSSLRGSMINSFISFIKHVNLRPFLLIFIILAVLDLCFIYLTRDSFISPSGTITITGTINDKAYDDENMLKSITVGSILCYVNRCELSGSYSIGSTVTVTGVAGEFRHAMNYGSFDAYNYYRARNIDYYINASEITVNKYHRSVRDIFCEFLYSLSDRVSDICTFESGTINTLLLGDKRNLPEERKLIYSQAGVSHFLVISGLHISAIGGFIYRLTKKIFKKRIPACIAAVIVLCAYGMLVGFGISVIRALIMYTVRLLSYIIKRTYDQLSALSLAGIITIFIFPYALTDSAFIYSYGTVFVISCFFIFSKSSKKRTWKARLINIIKLPVTLSAFIMPVTLYFSGSYSLLSIIYNILLIPLSVPILIVSALALIFCESGAYLPAKTADFVLHIILRMLDLIFEISTCTGIFSINGQPPFVFIILYYVFLLSFLVWCHHNEITGYLFKAVWFMSLTVFCFATFIPYRQITMLYTGQGECIVIKTGPHSAIISDCGSTSESDVAKYTVIPYLKAAGITTIDAILISHPDKDHTSGITFLLDTSGQNGIKIKTVCYPSFYRENSVISGILEECSQKKITAIGVSKGFTADIQGLSVRCISPDKHNIKNDTNLDSLVFQVSYNCCSLLLTGDISMEVEEKLVNENTGAMILKVPHHGSKSATGDSLLQKVNPHIAIISAGINNSYNHPHGEVISRLAQYGIKTYITKDSGEIDIFPTPNRMWIRTFID